MNPTKLISACLFLSLSIASCKKESVKNSALLQDGPLSEQLGKLVYLGVHQASSPEVVWGRNSNEFFLTARSGILRLDLAAQQIDVIDRQNSSIKGKTNENSGMIISRSTNQQEFFIYDFNSGSFEKISSFSFDSSVNMNISGNNIFYSISKIDQSNQTCGLGCIAFAIPFFHIDKQSKEVTAFDNKEFVLFSKDGSKTILKNYYDSRILYFFDNNIRKITDSVILDIWNNGMVFFTYNNVLQRLQVPLTNELTITNALTKEVVSVGKITEMNIQNGFKLSNDGTKFIYTGSMVNGKTQILAMYDIASRKEKIIAELPMLNGNGNSISSFYLSDDNSKVVVHTNNNELYVKTIE